MKIRELIDTLKLKKLLNDKEKIIKSLETELSKQKSFNQMIYRAILSNGGDWEIINFEEYNIVIDILRKIQEEKRYIQDQQEAILKERQEIAKDYVILATFKSLFADEQSNANKQ